MLMSHHLPNADLAVLSACQTATGDETLSEEVVHLTAGDAQCRVQECRWDDVVDF
ncbi:hypothetical protein BDY19DRAFT_981021 [Irpex rosettiformis]|uniref:Uncharacterized protein n=1 Tax=Irpex rosettiformis TaxID=378272 RepID=A0ACB8TM92_9APHY|nr:hypothetical protein BDY19DRAFT_981021 [Irpex rosettiformis]